MGRPRNKGGGVPPPMPKQLKLQQQATAQNVVNGGEQRQQGHLFPSFYSRLLHRRGHLVLGILKVIRPLLLVSAAFYFGISTFSSVLLPWGFPVQINEPRARYALLDATSDALQFQHGRTKKIVERIIEGQGTSSRLLKAPETILFDQSGTMLIMTEESQLVMLSDLQPIDSCTIEATANFLRDLGSGRPLGGAFGYGKSSNTLYIADAILGLTRIQNYKDPKSKLEIVVSSVLDDDDARSSRRRRRRLKYVDDVVIGRKSNKVYFTDASNIASDRIFRDGGSSWTWDTLYASKLDLLRGAAEGSVYEYDPSTDNVRKLASGLQFANGISIDPDERFLVIAATFGPRIYKYWLKGEKVGQLEVLVEDSSLPGYPDGVDCSPAGNMCFAVLPSSIVPIHKLLLMQPPVLDRLLRTLLLMLPRALSPPTKPYGGVLQIDTFSGSATLVQDPSGRDVSMLCGVTFHKGKLYLGSVHNNYIGVYDLDSSS